MVLHGTQVIWADANFSALLLSQSTWFPAASWCLCEARSGCACAQRGWAPRSVPVWGAGLLFRCLNTLSRSQGVHQVRAIMTTAGCNPTLLVADKSDVRRRWAFSQEGACCSCCVQARIWVVYGIKLDNGLDSLDKHIMLTL